MANAVKYVDNVAGNNGNTGDSEAQAYADIATALAAISGGGNTIYVQNTGTDYPPTAFPAALKGDLTDGPNRLEGYTTTPGARDGRPTITSSTNFATLVTLNDNDFWDFVHLNLTHTATSRGNAMGGVTSASSTLLLEDCVVDGCAQAVNGTSAGIGDLIIRNCEIKNCTGVGVSIAQTRTIIIVGGSIHHCAGAALSHSSSGYIECHHLKLYANGYGFQDTTTGSTSPTLVMSHCTIAHHTNDGIEVADKTGTEAIRLTACVFYGNGGYGIDFQDEKVGSVYIIDCAFGGNTSGAYTGVPPGPGEVSLTADPFEDYASGNYAPNNTAGGGALLRAGPGNADIGAVQHQDAGGGGVIPVIGSGGMVF